MSVWTEVDLTNIPTGLELLPKGTYTFSILPGAKFNDRDAGRVDFQLAVVGGEFAGKRVFPSFPNPTDFPWSPTVVARFAQALGVEFEAGEDPVQYLNRNANLHIEYPVEHKTDKTGVDRVNINLFKPAPAKQ